MCNLNNFCITYIETPYNKNKDEKNGRGWCKGVPLLRIGRRIAPCLLCVVTCAVCQMLRYAPQQAQALRFGSVQVQRTLRTSRHTPSHLLRYIFLFNNGYIGINRFRIGPHLFSIRDKPLNKSADRFR